MSGPARHVDAVYSSERTNLAMANGDVDPPMIAVSRSSTAPESPNAERPRRQERRTSPRIDTVGRAIASFRRKHATQSSSWNSKANNPDLRWHKKWNHECFKNGRVIFIDYVREEYSNVTDKSGDNEHRHVVVASQEFEDVSELEAFYRDPRRASQAALRVIHVSNAPWATRFLMKKFNIEHQNELVGMEGFSRWARFERPRLRNGKPFPSGRSWRVQMDPWRDITRTAVGMDYMKPVETLPPERRRPWVDPNAAQVMHLNAYPESSSPYGHEVSIQRFSVYLQRNLGPLNNVSPEDEPRVPYTRAQANGTADGSKAPRSGWHDETIDLDSLDNSSTIILFESSASTKLEDCLVQPRNDFEKRWRRLPFFLKKQEVRDDASVAAHCSRLILDDIFHGLAIVWEGLLTKASEHVALLEDKIYDNPADESRADELWTNQSGWLKVDKVMYLHKDLLDELQAHLKEMTADEEKPDDWLIASAKAYDKLAHSVQEDLIQPTNNLIDLMYKSVGIRDSRQSLQVGLAMWRLSWITFIFLPLTFIVGFFSMSVDIFDPAVPVWIYFVAAVGTLLVVIFLWYSIKSSLQRRRQTAFQRGVYERLYSDMEGEYPRLWTERGASLEVQPQGFWSKQKWWLLKYWFDPRRTTEKAFEDWVDEDAGLGRWGRLKRFFLRRWLGELNRQMADVESGVAMAGLERVDTAGSGEPSAVVEMARFTTPVLIADAEPEAAIHRIDPSSLKPPVRIEQVHQRRRSASDPRHSDDRPSSRASDALIIEERNLSDSESEILGHAASGADREEGHRHV